MVAAPVLTPFLFDWPASTEEGPPESSKRGHLRWGASRARLSPIGNWRWPTWGSFREIPEGLALAADGGNAGESGKNKHPDSHDFREPLR